MSEQFKVGEVLVFQNAELDPEYNGCEYIVMETGVHVWSIRTGIEYSGYSIQFADGVNGRAVHFQLRRRKPPATGEQSVMQMFVNAPQRVGVSA